MASMEISVDSTANSDPAYLAQLTSDLEETLRASGVESVERSRARAPEGAKGTGLEIAAIVIALPEAVSSTRSAMEQVRRWVRRFPGAKVSLEMEGNQLVLGEAAPEDERRQAEAFLSRHDAG
jgi:hypothetical protein